MRIERSPPPPPLPNTLARSAVVRIIARFSLAPSSTSHPSFDLFSLAELSVCTCRISLSLSHPISFCPRYTCWRLCECTRGRPREKSICPFLYIVPCGCLSLTLSPFLSINGTRVKWKIIIIIIITDIFIIITIRIGQVRFISRDRN